MRSNEITPFEGNEIRKIWHDEQWFFSVVDIIGILSESNDPSNYWTTIKLRDNQLSTICRRLKMKAADGKQRLTDCANTESIFRIIMSAPSPKAEPLKLWLAEQGKRAIEEAENPELSYDRMREIYRAKGHNDKWIKERIQSISTRKQLTDEWKNRGVKEGQEYSILTATIAKHTFGLTPSEHNQLKGLEKENFGDHMTPLELIFTSLREDVTHQIAINDNVTGFHDAAIQGGTFAGNDLLARITSHPDICHGKPVVRGLRYPVQNILELLASGMTHAEILDDYEDLEEDDLLACLQFAARLTQVKNITQLLAA